MQSLAVDHLDQAMKKHNCGDKLTFSRGPTVTHGQILVAMS